MNRRGLLKVLGLGAAAAPSVLNQTAAAVSGAPPIGIKQAGSGVGLLSAVHPNASFDSESKWISDELAEVTKYLGKMTTDKEQWISNATTEHRIHLQHHRTVDVDIAAMRSLSDTAKILLQARRNAERAYERDRFDYTERMERLNNRLKDLTKLF